MIRSTASRISWYFALGAVTADLTVSGNLLTSLGSSYITDGGLFIEKVHPGSYLAIASGIAAAISKPAQANGLWLDWRIAAFLGGITICMMYAFCSTGMGNIIVFIDTFLSAGMLALSIYAHGENGRRQIRRIAQCLVAINACIALVEFFSQSHLVPFPMEIGFREGDFRPTALYDHALTGAAVTMLGLWLAPLTTGFGKWSYVLLLAAALIVFGERTPIAACTISVVVCLFRRYGKRVLTRDLDAVHLAGVVSLPVAACAAVTILVLYMSASTRLTEHLYWDDSAQVRLSQFEILGLLDARELLFGCPRTILLALIEPLRLSSHVAVIENFWLFTFMALGLFLFPIFVSSLVALLMWLWRVSGSNGHLMIVLFVAVASASNSLGRKSTLLVTLVACVVASSSTLKGGRTTTMLHGGTEC